MKIAQLGDSVFDNRNYVKSEHESVKNVLRASGIPCQLYAVDGAVIKNVYSQLKKLKLNLT